MPLRILDNLDDVRIASPCDMSWDEMTGDARVRHCGSCDKNVFNLSSMTRVEALALVQQTEGRACLRFYRRADGTLLTADCPVGVRAALRRARRRTLLAAAACFAACASVGADVGASRVLELWSRRCTAAAANVLFPAPALPVMGAPPVPTMGEPAPVPESPEPALVMGKMAMPSR